MVAENWSLRIADFGSAQIGETSARDYCGTEMYIAPEVIVAIPFDLAPADVWSAGVTCFILAYGVPPFYVHGYDDDYFCCVRDRDWLQFWLLHERNRPEVPHFEAATKFFLQLALEFDPCKRPTAAGMSAHPWLSPEMPGGGGEDADVADLMRALGVA